MMYKKNAASIPLVSIGMPVYNGEKHIAEALDSLLSQTFTDFELIISDNGSNDETEVICKEYLLKDNRIIYVRQTLNRGFTANFQFVLDKSIGKYFMWAAIDDKWGQNFIEENLLFLESHNDYVASISLSIRNNDAKNVDAGSSILDQQDAEDRILKFIEYPGSNSRYYSLFKRDAIKEIRLEDYCYFVGDWSVIINVLKNGKFNVINGNVGFMQRAGISSNIYNYFNSLRISPLEFIIPYYYFSKFILTEPILKNKKILLIKHLIGLNIRGVNKYYRSCVSHYIRSIINRLHLEDELVISPNVSLLRRIRLIISNQYHKYIH